MQMIESSISRAWLRLIFTFILFSLVMSFATANAPEVSPGECLYLVGAPPGASAAAEEECHDDADIFEVCLKPVAGSAVNQFGDNMVQAWIERSLSSFDDPNSCRTFAWVSHDFRVPDSLSGPARATVSMEGFYRGVIDSGIVYSLWWGTFFSGAQLRVDLSEIDPLTGNETVIAEADVFRREIPEGILKLEGPFGRRLEATLFPGAIYRVKLYLEVWVELGGGIQNIEQKEVNFGMPGSSPAFYFAQYDSIRVCLEEPDQNQLILDRLDQIEAMMSENSLKLDQLLFQFDDMSVMECEQIRLLLTPEGKRSTTCCDVMEFPQGKDLPSLCGEYPEDENSDEKTDEPLGMPPNRGFAEKKVRIP